MLDVDGGDDVDPGREEVLDVLPALGVQRARRVGVGQLVHQRHAWPALQQRRQIHFGQRDPAVVGLPPRQHRKVAERIPGVGAVVILDDADHHIGPAFESASTFAEHGDGLADSGRGAEVHPEPAGRRRPGIV